MKKNLLLVLLVPFLLTTGFCKNNPGTSNRPAIPMIAGCNSSQSFSDLDIGNVRTRIWINGDMWWDLSGSPLYEVPKNSGKNSLFSGALWIGGKDASGNLRLAAQTYRQSGSDFWPGPIDTVTHDIDPTRCLFYDNHWKITRNEVANFINNGIVTQTITNWPGNGNAAYNESHQLAPFYDANGDGTYDPSNGDYPKYEFGLQSSNLNNRLNGDQTIWWVFNDVGNVHGETNAAPIGVEIQAQAYAFCTNDTDLSNTTFYTYKIINRGSIGLTNTYIGNHVDPDLGYYLDDYVGCDVERSMSYAYNGDNFDESVKGYGSQLPAVGVDLLEGPVPGQSIAMNSFMYYNNDGTVTGNPQTSSEYYNYMKSIWKDLFPLTYGGTGHNQTWADSCKFMFPGNSDSMHIGTYGVDYGYDWSEMKPTVSGLPNDPGDRRFLMSTGAFNFLPGQVVYITKAAIWVRGNSSIDTSLILLKNADDRIQSFFDSHFNNIPTCAVTIGIDELLPDEFSVYPSPATDYLMIHLKDQSSKMQVEIFSTDGKLVYQSKKTDSNVRIDVNNWSTGIYYYRLHSGSKQASGKISILN